MAGGWRAASCLLNEGQKEAARQNAMHATAQRDKHRHCKEQQGAMGGGGGGDAHLGRGELKTVCTPKQKTGKTTTTKMHFERGTGLLATEKS